jgi:putative sigma-54 modulation protein
MSIEITARHMNIGEETQDYAREKAERLLEDFPRVEHVHVILDHQKHIYVAEVVVQGRNHIRIEAEESSDDVIASLDKAVERAERQLRKERDKVQDHRVR